MLNIIEKRMKRMKNGEVQGKGLEGGKMKNFKMEY